MRVLEQLQTETEAFRAIVQVHGLGGFVDLLGWAYVVERGTLGHSNLFRHLGMLMPGDVAFIEAAKSAFRAQRTWRHSHDFDREPPSDSGTQKSA